VGAFALNGDKGELNTAIGSVAMGQSNGGYQNIAIGWAAMYGDNFGSSYGHFDIAIGAAALENNTTGYQNIAIGGAALDQDTTGYNNTASGHQALFQNTIGYANMASGLQALYSNNSGYRNTAAGTVSLYSNTTGHNNIGVGWGAGANITGGSNNIELGAAGSSSDANTIRIGTQGTHNATYIAGISGSSVTGADVVVSTTGKLGVLPSSIRYKRDIQALDSRSQGLWQLRPVTFRYKQDPSERQYGLIAEEVAKVYPELVVRGNKGEIESVQYRELIPLMLNEMQHQQTSLAELKAQNQALRTALAHQNELLAARLERLERTVGTKMLASR
jgi:hypothetical protein